MPFGIETFVENASNLWGTGKKVKENDREDAYQDLMRNERDAIQNRVAGAKAAGLHPLAALGFQAGASPSIPVGSQVAPGAFDSAFNKPDEEMRQAQLRLMAAQAADFETQASARSAAKLATQPGLPRPLTTDSDNLIPGQGLISGVKIKPSEITAGKHGLQAGTHQGALTVRVPTGNGSSRKMLVPGNELSQGLEDLDFLKTLITIAMNRGEIKDFFANDIPWAAKGYASDVGKAYDRIRASSTNPPRKYRGRGATGSW